MYLLPSWLSSLSIYCQRRVLAIFIFGFSSGLPLMLVFGVLSFWLREAGVSRADIGYFSWVALAYAIKWLWSPLADHLRIPLLHPRLGRRRSWLLVSQLAVVAAVLCMASTDPQQNLALMAAFAVLLAFASATQDINVDAFRIESAPEHLQAALAAGIRVRGAMSCTVGCPYEGDIAPERVAYLAGLLQGIGVQRVDVADTIGVGTPRKVQKALEATLQHFGIDEVSGHFHDTYGQALSNTLAALELGVWNFQSSVAGLGGCPYAKGATGNVATEDVVYMLQGMGIETGIDLDKLIDAGAYISDFLGRKPNSRAANALLTKRAG